MPDLDLRRLWKLHLIDSSLLEIRSRAATLDSGKKIRLEMDVLCADLEAKTNHAKSLLGEQTDLELQQKSIDEKLKRIDKDLYGGKVVNPREVEALQREITILKKQKGDMDIRILELWDAVPPAREKVVEAEKLVAEKRVELDEYQRKVLIYKGQLEKEFKERSEKRGPLAKEVPAALLARYEAIRQKHAGVGMASVSKNGSCEVCGTNLPRKLVESAKEGRVVTCEACHRILYAPEGLI